MITPILCYDIRVPIMSESANGKTKNEGKATQSLHKK